MNVQFKTEKNIYQRAMFKFHSALDNFEARETECLF